MSAQLGSPRCPSTPPGEPVDLHAILDSAGIGATVSEYDTSDVIFSQGDPATEVMYIRRGIIRKSVTLRTGREVVAILRPGEFFGEECLAGQPDRLATASAMTVSTVLTVDRRQMLGLLHRHPALADRFEEVLLGRDESRQRAAGRRHLARGRIGRAARR
jgi:CRP-like cAMP-binding protein